MAQSHEIKLNVDTGSSVDELNKLENVLSDIGDELVPLTTQMGDMEDKLMLMAYAGDKTSDEFKKLSEQVAGMRKSIRETDAGLEALSMTTSQKLSGALGGVTSGFEAFQGGMASFGVESAKVEEALLKVQSAMALSQGIQGIKEAIPSIKALGSGAISTFKSMTTASKAFALTGIGLAVTAVATLTNAFGKNNVEAEKQKEFTNAIADGAIEEANALDKLKVKINDETLSREEKNKAVKKLQEDYPNLLANVNAEKSSIEDLNKAIEINTQLVMLKAKSDAIASLRAEQYKKQLSEQLEVDQLVNENAIALYGSINNLTAAQKAEIEQMVLGFGPAKKNIEDSKTKINLLDEQDKALQKQIQNVKKLGATDEEYVKQKELSDEKLKQAEEKRKEAEEKRKEAQRQWLEEQKNILNSITQANYDYLNSKKSEEEQEVISSRDKWNALIKDAEKYKLDTKQLLINKEDEEKAIRKKYADEQVKAEQEKQDAINKVIKDAQNQQLDDREAFDQLYREATVGSQQLELDAVGEKYNYLVEMAKQYGYDTTKLEEDRLKLEKEINDKYTKEAEDKEIARTQKLKDLRIQAISDTLSTISNLSEIFAGKSEKSQKRAFDVQKAVSIAQATIDTYKAANAALGSAPPPFNYIAMAATITAGILNIKKIAQTKFEGGTSSGGGGTSVPSSAGGGVSNVMTPQFNIVGNNPMNQLAQLTGQPIQAYVVSGQITTAQSLDRNKIENATL